MQNEITSIREAVVCVNGVSRRFGATTALDAVELAIPRGSVFGLVGANGAGKTTLIKHVLGMLKPESGSVAVFGLDPIAEPTTVLGRIGYLAEVNELPEWMSVEEMLRFVRPFYPSWDEPYARALVSQFGLETGKQVGELSKGQRARLALVLTLAHRPELLVLDEPSSGLDPLVRRDILRAIIRTIADEGRTVLFSSHMLDEVERVADHIAIIEQGRIIQNDSLESLKARFHRMRFSFQAPSDTPPDLDGFLAWEGGARHWSAFYEGPAEEAGRLIGERHAEVLDCATPSLNEIFVALVGHEPSGSGVS